jgi:hypothetical protein
LAPDSPANRAQQGVNHNESSVDKCFSNPEVGGNVFAKDRGPPRRLEVLSAALGPRSPLAWDGRVRLYDKYLKKLDIMRSGGVEPHDRDQILAPKWLKRLNREQK